MTGLGFRSRAFSLVEFVIALSLLAIVAVFVVGFFLIGQSDRELQRLKRQAVSQHQELGLQLQDIFDDAVKNTGPTVEDGLLGIQRLSPSGAVNPGEPRAPSEDSDYIWMIAERFPDFTVPVSVPNPGPGEEPRIVVDMSVLDDEQSTYFDTGISNADYFIVSNIETTSIFQRDAGASFDGSEVEIAPPSDANYAGIFSGVNSRLTLAERVDLVVNDSNQLVIRYQNPSISRPDEVLAENVVDFDVNYRFSKQSLSGDVLTGQLSAPGDQGLCSGDSCVDWSDLAQVIVTVTYDLGVDWPDGTMSSVGTSYLELPSGNFGYVASSSFAPAKYKRGLGELGFQGDALCSVSNPLNRCNPDCAFAFGDSSPSSQAYELYGQHVESDSPSAYCMCGTDVDDSGNFESFSPPTDDMDLPEYGDGNEEERRRLDACLAHHAANDCGDIPRWLKDHHPLARVACYCVNNKENFLNEETFSYSDSNGRFSFSGDAIDELGNLVASGTAQTSDEFQCQNWQQGWPYWSNCDEVADDLWGTNNSSNWADACRCRPSEPNEDGTKFDDQNIWARDFDSMCSLPSATDACENLRPEDGNGDGIADDPAYQYFDPAVPDTGTEGFPIRGGDTDLYRFEMAIVCECLRASGETGHTPGSIQGGYDRYWDFRTSSSGDLLSSLITDLPGEVANQSSRGSLVVDVDVKVGGGAPFTLPGVVCNRAATSLYPTYGSISQCTHPDSSTSHTNRLRTDVDVSPWQEYCNGRCNLPNNTRLCQVRAALTNQNLAACGGWNPCVQGPPDPDPDPDGADEQGF